MNSLRPLLLILAWLLALLPADALALIPRQGRLPPMLPALRTAPLAEEDDYALSLQLSTGTFCTRDPAGLVDGPFLYA